MDGFGCEKRGRLALAQAAAGPALREKPGSQPGLWGEDRVQCMLGPCASGQSLSRPSGAALDPHTALRAHGTASSRPRRQGDGCGGSHGVGCLTEQKSLGQGKGSLTPAAARSAQGNRGPGASWESHASLALREQPPTKFPGTEVGPQPVRGRPCPTQPRRAPRRPSCSPKRRGREFCMSFH